METEKVQKLKELRDELALLPNKDSRATALQDEIISLAQEIRATNMDLNSSSGIIDESDLPSPTTLLLPEDYPKIFRNPQKLYAHPEDYLSDKEPITPQLFLYKDGPRSRLFLRISLKINDGFTAATFLLDTGACPHMYISSQLKELIRKRIMMDDAGSDFIKCKVGEDEINLVIKEDLPKIHQPANVMGLPMLFLMGLNLKQGRTSSFVYSDDGVADDVAPVQKDNAQAIYKPKSLYTIIFRLFYNDFRNFTSRKTCMTKNEKLTPTSTTVSSSITPQTFYNIARLPNKQTVIYSTKKSAIYNLEGCKEATLRLSYFKNDINEDLSKIKKNILIIKKPKNPKTDQAFRDLVSFLHSTYSNVNVLVEEKVFNKFFNEFNFLKTIFHHQKSDTFERVTDLIITLGGDASEMFPKECPPIISFSLGSLGFLLPFKFINFKTVLKNILTGKSNINILLRQRLNLTLGDNNNKSKDNNSKSFISMNEITLHRGSKPHLTTLKVSVNEQFLTDAVSDGLIISSATGSTAYNLSSGGPIVTLLLPSDCNIKLQVSQSSRIGCEVSVDGKNVGEINDGEEIVVTESDFPLPMVERETEGWIGDLNKILKWNIGFDNSNNGMKMDGMNVKVTSNDIAEANTIGTQLFWATSFLIMCLIERYSNYIQLKKESEAEKLIPTYIPIQEFLQKNKNEIEDFQKPHSFQINQNLTSSSYNDTVVENVNNVDATLEVNKNREVLIKTFLWTFNLALKYFIMLGIMSFNPLYFVFIIFGQSFGFYLTELRINGLIKMPCILKVRITSARDLPIMDRATEAADAFVEVKFADFEPKRTQIAKRTLNPIWNEDFRFDVSDDSDLQNEPLEIKILDHDTITYNDVIGTVFVDLNSLLSWDSCSEIKGWFPIFDTLRGIRGELNAQVKLQYFGDINPFKDSSTSVQFFSINSIPSTYQAVSLLGFVSALDSADDPEYHWSDNFRTPRTSNEARTRLMYQLSGQLRRQLGKRVLEMGGNAVVGYKQFFDLESEEHMIIARAIGTAVKLGIDNSIELNTSTLSQKWNLMQSPVLSPTALHTLESTFPPITSPLFTPFKTDNDQAGNASPTDQQHISTLDLDIAGRIEKPIQILTLDTFASACILGSGGFVSAVSVKLIENDDKELRITWWNELRDEIKSHAKQLNCNYILGYTETITIEDELCVLQCSGTATVCDMSLFEAETTSRKLSTGNKSHFYGTESKKNSKDDFDVNPPNAMESDVEKNIEEDKDEDYNVRKSVFSSSKDYQLV
ncbi:hypothetical protein HK099_007898 [Clydaea vesicula]|uniref:C2 domain-containing protein n=1 Tax=Clydaea vesicula TaxID=447962 RepID=A0AAD5U568_9FUNG|nr:hypothetical protein HK099_007898 [Clydaea vesicula]